LITSQIYSDEKVNFFGQNNTGGEYPKSFSLTIMFLIEDMQF